MTNQQGMVDLGEFVLAIDELFAEFRNSAESMCRECAAAWLCCVDEAEQAFRTEVLEICGDESRHQKAKEQSK